MRISDWSSDVCSSDLLHDVKEMERASLSLGRRSAGLSESHLGTVRISVDETMAEFLGRHLARLTANHRSIEFEIAVAHISANLPRSAHALLISDLVTELASRFRRHPHPIPHPLHA